LFSASEFLKENSKAKAGPLLRIEMTT
jgi:hypothetical protein